MNLNLLLFLIFIVAPIGTVIHELGHVIGASLVKSDRIIIYWYGKEVRNNLTEKR